MTPFTKENFREVARRNGAHAYSIASLNAFNPLRTQESDDRARAKAIPMEKRSMRAAKRAGENPRRFIHREHYFCRDGMN